MSGWPPPGLAKGSPLGTGRLWHTWLCGGGDACTGASSPLTISRKHWITNARHSSVAITPKTSRKLLSCSAFLKGECLKCLSSMMRLSSLAFSSSAVTVSGCSEGALNLPSFVSVVAAAYSDCSGASAGGVCAALAGVAACLGAGTAALGAEDALGAAAVLGVEDALGEELLGVAAVFGDVATGIGGG